MKYWTYNIRVALKYLGKPTSVHIPQYHFSNFAVSEILLPEGIREGVQEMICCFEDTNIEGLEQAKDTCDLIAAIMPDQWVIIDTGDYITSRLPWDESRYERETYDPHYRIYLVHIGIFNSLRAKLEEVDLKWRTERQAFADSTDPLPIVQSEAED